jgi:hypothetical protein
LFFDGKQQFYISAPIKDCIKPISPIAESPEPANIQLVNGMQGQVWST